MNEDLLPLADISEEMLKESENVQNIPTCKKK